MSLTGIETGDVPVPPEFALTENAPDAPLIAPKGLLPGELDARDSIVPVIFGNPASTVVLTG